MTHWSATQEKSLSALPADVAGIPTHFGYTNIRSESRIISTDALTEAMCGFLLICVAALSILERFPQHSQKTPNRPARSLSPTGC
jgi:hypothetical protein